MPMVPEYVIFERQLGPVLLFVELRWFKAAHFFRECLAAALPRRRNILLTAFFF
jgi:hypothetical protein